MPSRMTRKGGNKQVQSQTELKEGVPEKSPPPVGQDSYRDLASMLFGAASLFLLVAVIAFKVIHAHAAEELAILLFGFFGLGSAPLHFLPSIRGSRFTVTAIALGVATVILTGWALVELKIWWLGTPLFIIFAAAAALLHISRLRRRYPPRAELARSPLQRFHFRSTSSQSIIATTVVGFSVSLATALTHLHLIPKMGGLPTSIGFAWFAGLAILIVSILIAWYKRPTIIGLPVLALVTILTLTPSIVYDLPRYSWTQLHVGLTLYFLQHGAVNTHLNIYDSWPGFFAGIAWLCHVGGVSNIEALARWWTPMVDVAAAVVVQYFARVVGVSNRNAWLAAILFTVGNAVGQDYYSPQAMTYLAFLILFAIAIRPYSRSLARPHADSPGVRRLDWIVVIGLSVAIAVSHPLTPLMLAGMFVILAVFGVLKSRWMGVVPLVAASVWVLLHRAIAMQYFKVGDIGNVTGNATTPTAGLGYHYDIFGRLGAYGEAFAAIAVGVLALIAFLAGRRDRISWALAACAASTSFLVVFVHYGNEAVFRATLFAVPLLAILACRFEWRATRMRSTAIVVLLPVITMAYIFANMAFDYINVLRPADLSNFVLFQKTTPELSNIVVVSNPDYIPLGSVPRNVTFYSVPYDLPDRIHGKSANIPAQASALTGSVQSLVSQDYKSRKVVEHVYLMTSQQAAAVWVNGGVLTLKEYNHFAHVLATSSQWKVVRHTSTSTLLEFRTGYLLTSS